LKLIRKSCEVAKYQARQRERACIDRGGSERPPKPLQRMSEDSALVQREGQRA